MYKQIEAEIKQDYYNQFANDGQRFVAWYLRMIHDVDPLEVFDCITDGKNDKQIDAVYIDESDRIVHIIQGKFTTGKLDGKAIREMRAQWDGIKNLPSLQEKANPKLSAKIVEIREALDKEYDVCFELATTALLTDEAIKDYESLQTDISSDEEISCLMVLADAQVLTAKYDEAIDKEIPLVNHTFNIENDKIMELNDVGDARAIVALIPLAECIKIPGIKDQTLFSKNVRKSLGKSKKVNKGIASSGYVRIMV